MKGLFGLGKKKEDKEGSSKGFNPELKTFIVTYDKKGCIGAAACEAVDPKHWKVHDDRKAELIGAKLNEQTGLYELEISEIEVVAVKAAAEGCPKSVIHITDKATGEKIF